MLYCDVVSSEKCVSGCKCSAVCELVCAAVAALEECSAVDDEACVVCTRSVDDAR